jgi:hypothetical protein
MRCLAACTDNESPPGFAAARLRGYASFNVKCPSRCFFNKAGLVPTAGMMLVKVV